jgi:hypothetical protein
MRSALPRIWNDWLALLILTGAPILWVFADLNEIVLGATISGWTLVVQFYFRKAPDQTSDQ